jgi:ABC-2 type transport system ATP-binding protein
MPFIQGQALNFRVLLWGFGARLGGMEIPPPPASRTPDASLIEVTGLTKLYGDFPAVTDLSFNVRAGEVIGLVGPNGAGKTTTLRCLAGIIPATRGSVRICGHAIEKDPIEAKRRLAFFSDEPRLFDYLTVSQHLTFTARIYNVVDYEEIARALLEELEIADKADKLPGELSRGMKQKLAIACGFLHSPQVIFFDEPLTGLDPLGIRRMKDSILARAGAGAAILISSHLLHLLEEICSHVLILKGGRKIIDGTMEEVRGKFSEAAGGGNLEEAFFRATGES